MSPSSASKTAAFSAALSCLACALVVFLGGRAVAQPLGDIIVVPFSVSDPSPGVDAASRLEAELVEARLSVASLHDARDRFAARSRPPQLPTESDLDVLARAAREATEHVAFGRTSAAQKSVREVISRAERALESLNRETATARRILDACLSLVRSSLQTGHREVALEQATLCRRLVPDLAPAEAAHPANVVGVLAEADNLLRRMRIGNLTVRSKPTTGCSVYLNGRHLGTTPFRIDRAAAGEYRVQVECARNAGRVHVVQLGDAPVELLVDAQFDAAITGEPRLLLRYASHAEARAHLAPHAAELGRAVGVDDVILVGVRDHHAELLRVHVPQQRLVGRALVPLTPDHDVVQRDLAQAIVVLAEGRDEAAADSPPPARAPTPPPLDPPPARPEASSSTPSAMSAAPLAAPLPEARPQASESRPTRRLRRLGIGLLGPSVGLFTLGIASELRARSLENDAVRIAPALERGTLAPAERARLLGRLHDIQARFETFRKLRWIGTAGAGLAAVSTALLVRPRKVLPWWSWAIGGVGLGLIGVGAFEIAARDRCELRSPEGVCRRTRDSVGRAALLLSAAAPLLTVPLAQHVQARFRSSVLTSALPEGGFRLALRVTH